MLSNYTTSTYFVFHFSKIRSTRFARLDMTSAPNRKLWYLFEKALIFYYFLLPFCKRLWYNIFKLSKKVLQTYKKGMLCYVENSRNRYERRSG